MESTFGKVRRFIKKLLPVFFFNHREVFLKTSQLIKFRSRKTSEHGSPDLRQEVHGAGPRRVGMEPVMYAMGFPNMC